MGGHFAVLNNGPTYGPPYPAMAQTIAGLEVGAQYQLTWDMKSPYGRCGSMTAAGARAAIDGNVWNYPVFRSQTSWLHYSESFVAAHVTAVLEFSSQRDGDQDAAFDNIVLTRIGSPIPEPATGLLLGAGLSLLAWRRRAR